MSRKKTPVPQRSGRPSVESSGGREDSGSLVSAMPARNSNYRELFQRIERRNGEIVDFDKSKITAAIWKAAQSVGGSDFRTADLLADKVILYLSRTHDDHLLTIEEVQDAVEKVLIEQGHAKTAKAYILYRQERARVRKFREGQRAGAGSALFETTPGQPIEVLTSGEQLVRWNRERITQALVRETGLAWSVAEQISREVERQIIYSKTSRLTASLIREMVNVKLLEYGYQRERQLHSRLGVPLYDVEQMVQGCWEEGRGQPLEKALSGEVLRQYALSRIYSNEVAEAHLRGDLYLHDLTQPWRVAESVQAFEYLKKAKLGFPDCSGSWALPRTPSDLITRLGKFNALLEGGVRRRSLWDGVNVFLAPFLDGESDEQLRAVARALLFETAGRVPAGAARFVPVRALGFYFHIPRSLWNTAALGPESRYSGKTYAYYEETARRFLEIFLSEQAAGDAEAQPLLGPEFCFHLDAPFFKHPQVSEDLARLEAHLPRLARWCAWLHGEQASGAWADHFCADAPSPEDETLFKYPWKMRSSVGPAITLNLPALAGQAGGSRAELAALLEQQVHLSFTAFRQHRQFVEQLAARGGEATEPLLHCQADGEPFLREGRQRARLAIAGLADTAEQYTGRSSSRDPAWRRFVEELLRELVQKVQLCAQSCRLPCEVALDSDPDVLRRLALVTTEGGCGPREGGRGPTGTGDSRTMREVLESSQWHALLTACGQLTLSSSQLCPEEGESSLAELLRQLFKQGREERLVVTRPLRICQTCSRLLQGVPDICPHCGSLQLASLG